MVNSGYSLLSMLCSLSISLVVTSFLLHYLVNITCSFVQIHNNIDYQQAILLASQYLRSDIKNAGFSHTAQENSVSASTCKANSFTCQLVLKNIEIKADSDVLLLHNVATDIGLETTNSTLTFRSTTIAYYLRQSITDPINHNHCFSLYRDDLQRTAQALIEGITEWQVKLSPADDRPLQIQIVLTFKNAKLMELIFVPLNQLKA